MENGYEVLKSHYDEIVEKVTEKSNVFKKEDASLEDESPWTINPMVSFIGDASTGLSYSAEDELTGETDKPWMWWVENVGNDDEYHRFATFEEALDDWVANLPRIDRLAKKA